MSKIVGHYLSQFHGSKSEFEVLIAYSDGREIGHSVRKPIADLIGCIEAQNEWLKDRLSSLQLPPNSHKNIEEWLVECGMPTEGRS